MSEDPKLSIKFEVNDSNLDKVQKQAEGIMDSVEGSAEAIARSINRTTRVAKASIDAFTQQGKAKLDEIRVDEASRIHKLRIAENAIQNLSKTRGGTPDYARNLLGRSAYTGQSGAGTYIRRNLGLFNQIGSAGDISQRNSSNIISGGNRKTNKNTITKTYHNTSNDRYFFGDSNGDQQEFVQPSAEEIRNMSPQEKRELRRKLREINENKRRIGLASRRGSGGGDGAGGGQSFTNADNVENLFQNVKHTIDRSKKNTFNRNRYQTTYTGNVNRNFFNEKTIHDNSTNYSEDHRQYLKQDYRQDYRKDYRSYYRRNQDYRQYIRNYYSEGGSGSSYGARRFALGMGSMGSVLGKAGLHVGGAGLGGYALTSGASAYVGFSDQMRAIESRVKNMTSTSQEYKETLDALIRTSKETGSSIGEITSMFHRMSTAKGDLSATNSEITRFAESVAKLGHLGDTSRESMKGAMEQLTQSMGRNFLAQEFNSIVRGMPEIMKFYGDKKGLSERDIRDKMRAGNFHSKDLFDTIVTHSGEIDERYASYQKRLFQSMGRLTTSMMVFSREIDKELGVADKLTSIVEGLAKSIDDLKVEDLGKTIKVLTQAMKDAVVWLAVFSLIKNVGKKGLKKLSEFRGLRDDVKDEALKNSVTGVSSKYVREETRRRFINQQREGLTGWAKDHAGLLSAGGVAGLSAGYHYMSYKRASMQPNTAQAQAQAGFSQQGLNNLLYPTEFIFPSNKTMHTTRDVPSVVFDRTKKNTEEYEARVYAQYKDLKHKVMPKKESDRLAKQMDLQTLERSKDYMTPQEMNALRGDIEAFYKTKTKKDTRLEGVYDALRTDEQRIEADRKTFKGIVRDNRKDFSSQGNFNETLKKVDDFFNEKLENLNNNSPYQRLIESMETDGERLNRWYEESKKILDDHYDKKLGAEDHFTKRWLELKKEGNESYLNLERAYLEERDAEFKNKFLNFGSGLLGTFAKGFFGDKKGGVIGDLMGGAFDLMLAKKSNPVSAVSKSVVVNNYTGAEVSTSEDGGSVNVDIGSLIDLTLASKIQGGTSKIPQALGTGVF